MKRPNLIPFKPVGKSFLVEIVVKDTTDSGLLLPNGVSPDLNKEFKGLLVLSVGDLCDTVQPGDTVLMKDDKGRKPEGLRLNIDGKEVLMLCLNEYDVFAVRSDIPVVDSYKFQSTRVFGEVPPPFPQLPSGDTFGNDTFLP